jgi:hypothetical protein
MSETILAQCVSLGGDFFPFFVVMERAISSLQVQSGAAGAEGMHLVDAFSNFTKRTSRDFRSLVHKRS